MEQWGFFLNQNRCLGCKTCVLACKNWNEGRRGDVLMNVRDTQKYVVGNEDNDKKQHYIDPISGSTNYNEFSKFFMKENWRRVDTFESGATVLSQDNTFDSSLNKRYITVSCNHCDDPACVKACPVSCNYKENTIGAVLHSSGCISCGRCKAACPWGAPQYYDPNFGNYAQNDPARPIMTKCTLCIDRIKEGLKPACVAACWNRALDAGPIRELREKYTRKGYTVVNAIPGEFDDLSTKPNIIFVAKK